MSQQENESVLDNESNLLQSTIQVHQQPITTKPPPSDNPHDEIPIGGGKKFDFSEYPEEGDTPKQVKKVIRKPPARFTNNTKPVEDSKISQQQQHKIPLDSEQHVAKPAIANPDDIPIGGKKFQFSEFPEQGQQVKKPLKKPPAKFLQRMKKSDNKQEQAQQQNDKSGTEQVKKQKQNQNQNSNKINQENQPIGQNKMSFDEQPIGSKKINSFDEQQIGGGKKFQFSQYPEEGAPVVQKKVVKKAAKVPVKKPMVQSETPINNDEIPIGGGSKAAGEFDEVPIGKSAANNNFMMSQFPEGDEQPVVETNYPMSQKLKSKAVKLKLSGMEDLLELLTNDPNNSEIGQIQIGKFLKETNPACLQKILQCLKVWIEKDKRWGDDETKNCIENGYINGKPNTKKLSVEVVDLMYEKSPEVVEMAILVGLKGKVPKNLAGYLAILNQMLSIYGMKRLKFLKPYFADIVIILNRQKLVAVKNEGMNILKQSYKWLSKQVVEPLTKDIKEGLKKQLDTFWETYDKSQVMTAPKDIPEVNDGKPKKKVDAYQLSQAFDVFKKFNEKWSEGVINEQKWSEKVRMMTQFYNAANVPKLAHNSESRHINQLIRRLINHSNFNVVLWDLKILAVLAKGLRKHFSSTVKAQFLNVIEKFRQKRTQMVDETFNTLNQFNHCISIEDVIDDVKKGLGDKAPTMKVNLLNWIGKFVEKKVEEKDEVPDKAKDALKSLFPIFEKLLTDGVAEVRDSMIKNLGKMKILMGDDFFVQIDKKMSKGQAGKMDEIKKQMPKKVSRQKDKKQTESSTIKMSNNSTIRGSTKNLQSTTNQNQGKNDISDEIQDLIPKMNHSDWQKRKQAAQAAISLISNNMDSKMNSGVLNDFLNTLKPRIADPNKNVVKYFVQLTVLIFQTMTDRDIKANAKNFICSLADGLSDKVEANKKQISLALNKLGGIYGREQLLSILGGYLDNDKQSRIQAINIILQNYEYIDKADTREYPKGIIRGLVDKNKQIRNLAEKLLQILSNKVGIDVFKNLARNQRPAIAKDLNALFDKYSGGVKNNASTLSKGVSPPKSKPPAPVSGKKISQRSSSKNSRIHNESFDQENQSSQNLPVNRQYYSTLPSGAMNSLKINRSFVEGNEQFAPLKIMNTQRVQRQQKDQRFPWMCDAMIETQEEQLRQSIETLFKQELSKKMFSIDYRKVLQAGAYIVRLSKDIAYHNQLREAYDLILKWVFIRLWGGNPAVMNIIEVLPSVMSILQKKKLVLGDGQVDIIVAILRESFITGYMNENKVSDQLILVTKFLIALGSGDRILKKLLKQFTVELPTIHRHVRQQATEVYRAGLRQLIKKQLMEYVGNGSTLEEASRIKQLKGDYGFVQLLYKRFHQNVLDSFGFRNNVNAFGSNSIISNNASRLSPVPIKKIENYQQPKRETVQPSGKRTPTQSIEGRATIHKQELARNTVRIQQSQAKSNISQQGSAEQYDEDFDLKAYARPSVNNPLGKNLQQLQNVIVDDKVFSFFSAMLNENDKSSPQLANYANVVFGTILKSVKVSIDNRNNIAPQKIVNHITLLQSAIKCRSIICNIDKQLLYVVTKFALYQLVYQDEYKNVIAQNLNNRNIDFKPDQFVKVINGIMLRILENACPQQTVNVLLSLLNKQLSMQQMSNKTVSLIVKCLSRVSTNYLHDVNALRTRQFIIRAIQCFSILNFESLADFNPAPDERLTPQKNIIKTLKQIIGDLVKNYGEDIWLQYDIAKSQSRTQDNYIAPYLQFLGVAYPENAQTLPLDDQNLKKINDLLSKSKTFDLGIVQLKKYMNANPLFVPIQYFTSRGYEQRFLVMVMNALQSSRLRKTPTKRQIREQRSQNSRSAVNETPTSQSTIQDKINKLKMRFDEPPANRQQDRSIVPTPPPIVAGRRDEDRGEERANEIKRRIDEMRNRLNKG